MILIFCLNYTKLHKQKLDQICTFRHRPHDQVNERPTDIWEVMGSKFDEDSDFLIITAKLVTNERFMFIIILHSGSIFTLATVFEKDWD